MTPKTKKYLLIGGGLALLAGVSIYLYLEHEKAKKELEANAGSNSSKPADTSSQGSSTSQTKTQTQTPSSQTQSTQTKQPTGGLSSGQKLWAVTDTVAAYSYPQLSQKYVVGLAKKSSSPIAFFKGKANVPGFIKATMIYTDLKGNVVSKDAYAQEKQLTPVAP